MSDPRFQPTPESPAPAAKHWPYKSALVIVAHPDDETLWVGGTILMHPETRWTVVALSRRSDPDRAPKFRRVLALLGATGELGDLDDGPEQTPLLASDVQDAVLTLVGRGDPDLILTHSVSGEYTRHRRHEEIGKAVLSLWDAGTIQSRELWAFAYRDTGAGHAVNAIKEAEVFEVLPPEIWKRKHGMVTGIYGFAPDSFEANAALREEAFWRLRQQGDKHESASSI